MFSLVINGVQVLFTKFFSEADVAKVTPEFLVNKVVFIDTPPTKVFAKMIEDYTKTGCELYVRDHHDVTAQELSKGGRAGEIRAAADLVRDVLGGRALVSTRSEHPACSTLVGVGEFIKGFVIVADPDCDGLTAAMKAAGVIYPELDADAAVLDGPRSMQNETTLSPLALLLAKGLSTLPLFDRDRPRISEDAKSQLFQDFLDAVQGSEHAKAALKIRVASWEDGVKTALAIAMKAVAPCPGVVLADAVGMGRHDFTTLITSLEDFPNGCRVTVVRKDNGPIAKAHGGVQYSLAVVNGSHSDIDLRQLLPKGFVSSPESGIISNTSFLLHVSEKVWNETVLFGLRARFAPLESAE